MLFRSVSQSRYESLRERMVNGIMKFGASYTGHSLDVEHTEILTVPGDCGSVIVMLNTAHSEKIIGIHSGATTREGFGAIVTQEMFKSALPNCQQEGVDEIVILKHQAV